jgi:hypothetical protein
MTTDYNRDAFTAGLTSLYTTRAAVCSYFSSSSRGILSFFFAFSLMPESSIAQHNHEDEDYQRALTDATFAVEEICSKIDDCEKLILVTKNNIDELKEELVLARNNIGDLNKDLVLARKKVAGIKFNRRIMEFGGVVANETIVQRMVSKIKDVLRTIDELAELGFVLPVTIGMGLEILIALPENAYSEIAASAYTEIAAEIKQSDVDPMQLSILDHQITDVVCFAVARFIDHNSKEAREEGFTLAFGGHLLPGVNSRLGNSLHHLFKRDFIENPARTPGYKPTDVARPDGVRNRGSRGKRNKSEPASESRSMTGTSTIRVQLFQ